MPKKTEDYEQLLARFTKRKEQLTKEQETFREAHEKWVHLDERLSYLPVSYTHLTLPPTPYV